MSPLPPWFDLVLFPLSLASLFGYGLFISGRFVSLCFHSEEDRPDQWGGEVERMAVAYGLGYGFLSLSMLGIGLLGWLYGPVIWSVLILGLFLFFRLAKGLSTSQLWDELRPHNGIEKVIFGFLVFYFAFRFLGCWVPGWGYDEAMYHLTIPRQFLFAHRIHPTPNVIQANFPLNSQMTFLFLLGMGGEVLCHLFQWAQYLLLGAVVIRWARKLDKEYGYLAFLIYCSSTLGVYFRAPEEVHSDIGVAVYFALSMLVLVSVFPKYREMGIALAGIFNGLAWGTKYTAFVFVTPLLLTYLIGKLRERNVPWIRIGGTLCLFLSLSTFVFAPWMARGLAFTSNPLYPLFDTVFPSPPPYDTMAERLREYEAYSDFYSRDSVLTGGQPFLRPFRVAWAALLSLNSDKTHWPFRNGGYLLLLNLAIPICGLISRRLELRLLSWTAVVGNLLYVLVFGMHLSRFYSVVYPLAAILVADAANVAGARIGRPQFLKVLLVLFAASHLGYWQIRWLDLQGWWGIPCLTQEAQRAFLVKRYAGPQAVAEDEGGWEKALKERTPADAYVLGHGVRMPLHSPRRIYYVGDFEEELLVRLFRDCGSAAAVANCLLQGGFTHILFRKTDLPPSDLPEARLKLHTQTLWEDDVFELRRILPESG